MSQTILLEVDWIIQLDHQGGHFINIYHLQPIFGLNQSKTGRPSKWTAYPHELANFRKTIWFIHYIWTLQWHHFEVNNALLLYPISEIPIPSFMMCGIWSVDCGDVTIIVKHWNLAILISSPISLHLSCNFHSTIKIPI